MAILIHNLQDKINSEEKLFRICFPIMVLMTLEIRQAMKTGRVFAKPTPGRRKSELLAF